MIDITLREKMLEAPYVIRDFVNDEPECNYERYLTELINNSEYFMRKSKGKAFQWVENQDHGECDAISEIYSIDYKLLATRSSLQGLRETSGSITKYLDGAYEFGVGRWPKGVKFTYLRTAAALRHYSGEDFLRIANNPSDFAEKEISTILKSLRVKKNLFLFYPYIMSFSEPHIFENGCKSIEEAFNNDFHEICLYRRREVPGFDTFLCTVYDQKLLAFEDDDGFWRLVDSVDLFESEIYEDLYYSYGNYGFN